MQNIELKNYIQDIQKDYGYKKVILFGSYANGTNREDSDIDLLVEFDKDKKSIFLIANLINNIQEKFNLNVDIIPYPIKKTIGTIDLRIDNTEVLYG